MHVKTGYNTNPCYWKEAGITLCYLTRGPRVHVNTTPIGNAFWVRVKPFMPVPRVPLRCGPVQGYSPLYLPPHSKSLQQNLCHHCHGPWVKEGRKEIRFGNVHPQTRLSGVWVPAAHTNQLELWNYVRLSPIPRSPILGPLGNQDIPPSSKVETALTVLNWFSLTHSLSFTQTFAAKIWVLGMYL